MNKAIKDLIATAKEASRWIKDATPPGELNKLPRKLDAAIKRAEQLGGEKSSGHLLLLQRGDGLRRITATVETGDKYLSRVGWTALGVEAEVIYAAEVSDLEWARETLKTMMPDGHRGQGMEWAETPKADLIATIKKVKAIVNNGR
jgi:hypothetical protein